MPTAAYDEIADWYEHEFLSDQRASEEIDPLGVGRALRDLLGPGRGLCLDIGCGTGVHAATVRGLGWTRASWTDRGVRARVGATHRPLPELLHAFLEAGLTLERFAEGGAPTPTLAIRARKPR